MEGQEGHEWQEGHEGQEGQEGHVHKLEFLLLIIINADYSNDFVTMVSII